MNEPLVSVVIPAYNSADTIREALDSVAAQSFRDYEMIVVDDASTDSTVSVVNAWGEEHWEGDLRSPESRSDRLGVTGNSAGFFQVSGLKFQVSLLRLPRNSGPAAARNAGVAAAKGEWIAFLDADDVWLPWRLSAQMAWAARKPDVVMWCGWTITMVEGEPLPTVEPAGDAEIRPIALTQLALSNPVSTSTVLVRRSALIATGGFDVSFRGPEDYDLWMRIAAKHPVAVLSSPLAGYRSVHGSLSLDDRRFLPQVLRVLDKAFGDGGSLAGLRHLRRRSRATQYFSASWMAYNRGAILAAVRHLVRSWCLYPGRLPKEAADPVLRWRLLFRYVFGAKPGKESIAVSSIQPEGRE